MVNVIPRRPILERVGQWRLGELDAGCLYALSLRGSCCPTQVSGSIDYHYHGNKGVIMDVDH
jgi:hypothetical protein